MTVYLVRHAKAGDRDRWVGPDEERPLTPAGQAQAEKLVEVFAAFGVDRILSSPYLRCLQTVAPLSVARGITVEATDDLAEGAGAAAQRLVATLEADAVLCTHGDVLYDVLADLDLAEMPMKKGSTWVLEVQDGRVADARYLPPPA